MVLTLNETLLLSKLSILISLMVIGSISDWTTRYVDDWLWYLAGIFGLIFIETDIIIQNLAMVYQLFIPLLIIFYFEPIVDYEKFLKIDEKKYRYIQIILYTIGGLLVIIIVSTAPLNTTTFRFFMIIVMILFAQLLFYMNLYGGADAKALFAIALLFPVYPRIGSFPLISIPYIDIFETVFPFALLVLLNSALLFIIVPLIYIIYNASRRNLRFPLCLFGYQLETALVQKKFVWLMEYVDDETGKLRASIFPLKDEENYAKKLKKLQEKNIQKVWVTPQIPFIIPMTVGIILSTIIGNPVFLLFALSS